MIITLPRFTRSWMAPVVALFLLLALVAPVVAINVQPVIVSGPKPAPVSATVSQITQRNWTPLLQKAEKWLQSSGLLLDSANET